MSREKYTHMQVLLPEIRAMEAAGKTKREIAEHFGLRDKYVVKQLLTRERRKEAKAKAGISPRPKGRPRKDGQAPHQREKSELDRLRMENKLLRDFLQLTGRK